MPLLASVTLRVFVGVPRCIIMTMAPLIENLLSTFTYTVTKALFLFRIGNWALKRLSSLELSHIYGKGQRQDWALGSLDSSSILSDLKLSCQLGCTSESHRILVRTVQLLRCVCVHWHLRCFIIQLLLRFSGATFPRLAKSSHQRKFGGNALLCLLNAMATNPTLV